MKAVAITYIMQPPLLPDGKMGRKPTRHCVTLRPLLTEEQTLGTDLAVIMTALAVKNLIYRYFLMVDSTTENHGISERR